MNFLAKFKVLPILVLIAAVCFGVRFGDFIKEATQIDDRQAIASANAAETVDSEPLDDENLEEELNDEMSDALDLPEIEEAKESPEWRDSSESDIEYSEVNMKLFDDLATRRKELEMRERELSMRGALLTAAEQELEQKYKELTSLKAEIEELLVTQSEEESARTASLVKIYEGMKPKDAARIFNTLEKQVLLEVVSQMSERKSAPVLASMEPDKARALTIMLMEKKSLSKISEKMTNQ